MFLELSWIKFWKGVISQNIGTVLFILLLSIIASPMNFESFIEYNILGMFDNVDVLKNSIWLIIKIVGIIVALGFVINGLIISYTPFLKWFCLLFITFAFVMTTMVFYPDYVSTWFWGGGGYLFENSSIYVNVYKFAKFFKWLPVFSIVVLFLLQTILRIKHLYLATQELQKCRNEQYVWESKVIVKKITIGSVGYFYSIISVISLLYMFFPYNKDLFVSACDSGGKNIITIVADNINKSDMEEVNNLVNAGSELTLQNSAIGNFAWGSSELLPSFIEIFLGKYSISYGVSHNLQRKIYAYPPEESLVFSNNSHAKSIFVGGAGSEGINRFPFGFSKLVVNEFNIYSLLRISIIDNFPIVASLFLLNNVSLQSLRYPSINSMSSVLSLFDRVIKEEKSTCSSIVAVAHTSFLKSNKNISQIILANYILDILDFFQKKEELDKTIFLVVGRESYFSTKIPIMILGNSKASVSLFKSKFNKFGDNSIMRSVDLYGFMQEYLGKGFIKKAGLNGIKQQEIGFWNGWPDGIGNTVKIRFEVLQDGNIIINNLDAQRLISVNKKIWYWNDLGDDCMSSVNSLNGAMFYSGKIYDNCKVLKRSTKKQIDLIKRWAISIGMDFEQISDEFLLIEEFIRQ